MKGQSPNHLQMCVRFELLCLLLEDHKVIWNIFLFLCWAEHASLLASGIHHGCNKYPYLN